MKTQEGLYLRRVRQMDNSQWRDYRETRQALLRATLGDWSQIGDMAPQDLRDTDRADNTMAVNDDDQFRVPLQLRDVKEGRMNHMIRALRNISMSIANPAPIFEFDGVEQEHALFHRLYTNKRLGPRPHGCDFYNTQLSLIWDAMFSIGWAGIFFEPGVVPGTVIPSIARIDPSKLIWDTSGPTPASAKWVAFRAMERASYWAEKFGKKHFMQFLEGEMDPPVDVMFYYDVTDPGNGIYRAYLADAESEDMILDKADGPDYPFLCRYEVAGEEYALPFLPCEPLYFDHVPGTPYPDSLVYRMIPHQLALLEANARLLAIVRAGPRELWNLNGLSDDSRAEVQSGRRPDILTVASQAPGALENVLRVEGGVPLDTALMQLIAECERMITAMSGEDPFTSGATNKDSYEFATSVAAVQNASQLSVDYRADRVANWMSAIVRKWLAVVHEYDAAPMVLQYKKVKLEFTTEDRVGAYIQPDVDVIVRRDNYRYMPDASRIARAKDLLQTAATIGDPAMIESAVGAYLDAQGVEDPDSWLTMDQTEQGVPAPPPVA